jgi:uncharacterized protein YciI
MFIVLLKFSDNQKKAADLMEAHKAWLKKGFDEGIFLLAGSLLPSQGGAILAKSASLDSVRERVSLDPFVVEKVVTAEILEVKPSLVDSRLAGLF